MAAGRYRLVIEQGATLDRTFKWKDGEGALVDITGYTARCQVRASFASETKLLDLTTENGGIELGGAAGTIRLLASATTTAALVLAGLGVWDLELVSPGGVVTRLLEGRVVLSREVTR